MTVVVNTGTEAAVRAVAGEGAVGNERATTSENAAAVAEVRAVTGEGTVGNGQRETSAVNAAAVAASRAIPGEGTVGNGQRAFVGNAATEPRVEAARRTIS